MATAIVICRADGGKHSCHVISTSPADARSALTAAQYREGRRFSMFTTESAGDWIVEALDEMEKSTAGGVVY